MEKKNELKTVFTKVYQKNLWGDKSSVSGPGSNLDQTAVIREKITDLIKKYEIKSIIDAPCGDFFWMKEIFRDTAIDFYKGLDIVPELIESNIRKYQTERITFHLADLTMDTVSEGDLIICRDCFLHLSYRNIYYILKDFKKSRTKYLLVSSYPGHANSNVIKYYIPGRAINLEKSPFKISSILEVINENYWGQNGEYSDKCLILLEIGSVNLTKIYIRVLINEIFYIPKLFIFHLFNRIIKKVKSPVLTIIK